MSIIPTKSKDRTKDTQLETVAPAPHVEALLSILEETDKELTRLTSSGLDGRTARILREIEKSGAISLTTDGGDLLVDVIDRKRAIAVVDHLISSIGQKTG